MSDAEPTTSRPRVTRRAVLIGAAGGIAGLALGAVVLSDRDTGDDATTPTTEPSLAPSASRVAQIVALGARYRQLAPQDTTAAALAEALPGPSRRMTHPAAVEDLLAEKRTHIRAEYREADIVEIDGWRIARTEAQLAAIASLREGG